MKTVFSLIISLGVGSVILSCDRCKASGSGDDCVCYEIYAPVCGCDGKTYGNDCRAECAGVEYKEGACK